MTEDKKLIRNSTAEFLVFSAQGAENTIEVRYTWSISFWRTPNGY